MAQAIRKYITGLDGSSMRAVLTGDEDIDNEMQYRALLITFDVPAPHILGLPKDCVKAGGLTKTTICNCKKPCGQKLKSMRNKLNYWLRENCMRVSDSEYMVPQTTPEEINRISNEFVDMFVIPYGILYTEWRLSYVLEKPYAIGLDANGMVTKAAQALLDLFTNVENTLDSVETAIRFHQNMMDADVFETNKFTFDMNGEGKERATKLNPTAIRRWYKKIGAYEEVLGDFLNEDTTEAANLGSVANVETILKTCLDRIQVAAVMAGINLE